MLILTRAEAGRRIAAGLGSSLTEPPLVLALSPSGARVAADVAAALGASLDIIAVNRLEVPGRPHAVFGAVADGTTILDEDRVRELCLPDAYVDGLIDQARSAATHRATAWREGAAPIPVAGRTVALVDDGLSDLLAVAAAVRALTRAGASRVVFAAPTCSRTIAARLESLGVGTLFLIPPGSPAGPLLRDPTFAQTTPHDVGQMVRRSRPDLTAIRGA